jgi:tetrapyrrole methylase family protein/MazG family protein/ATP diphosphatase
MNIKPRECPPAELCRSSATSPGGLPGTTERGGRGLHRRRHRRHQHQAGEATPRLARTEGDAPLTSGQVIEKWETLKAREREAAGVTPKKQVKTTLSGVPKTLPSLLRAYEISSRAAAVGFDWAQAADVLDKIEEEVAEVQQEVESGATGDLSRAEEEMGDLLFAIANLSRKLGIEPEAALRRANEKFTSRFDAVEQALEARGQSLATTTLEEMEAEWQRVKETLGQRSKVKG